MRLYTVWRYDWLIADTDKLYKPQPDASSTLAYIQLFTPGGNIILVFLDQTSRNNS